MLERFYDPLIGQVTLDGVDIRELNVASYRSEMALVSQEPVSDWMWYRVSTRGSR
jgi:ATP-binding cassette subfamily B (MDR/TAP) protein 1